VVILHAIKRTFEGKPFFFDLVRQVVSSLSVKSKLLSKAREVLRETSVVMGEFGFDWLIQIIKLSRKVKSVHHDLFMN